MSTEEKSWEDNGWIIGGTILAVLILVGTMFYFVDRAERRSDAKYAAQEKERLARPIVDLRNGFIEVQQMNCHKIIGGYTKRQLSKLTEEEKWLVKDSVECGVTFQHVRWVKSGILGYSPHYSIFLWRNDEDANDPGGPLHVEEINIENCQVALKNKPGQAKLVQIEGKCSLLDKVL